MIFRCKKCYCTMKPVDYLGLVKTNIYDDLLSPTYPIQVYEHDIYIKPCTRFILRAKGGWREDAGPELAAKIHLYLKTGDLA